jgi:hypothetical protein
VIRSLTPDELPWFLARAFAFVGHGDAWGLAQRCVARLGDARRDAGRAWVLEVGRDGADRVARPPLAADPLAGIVAWPPDLALDEPTLRLAQPWHDGDDPGHFVRLVEAVLRREPHEAVELDLSAVDQDRAERLAGALGGLGFVRDELRTLDFDLTETPPIGRPLVLEAWRTESDAAFRGFVGRCEGMVVREGRWAWLKRVHGPFTPDLCLLAFETLDQPPVGYALAGRRRPGIDAALGLTAIGVAPEHRGSTEMLRRLLVTVLQEFAGQSPWGRVRAELSGSDPKLMSILRSIGFAVGEVRPVLRRLPE